MFDPDQVEFIASPHEIDDIPGCYNPPQFSASCIHNWKPSKAAVGHCLNRCENRHCRWNRNDIPCCDGHDLTFPGHDVGLELDRSPIEFTGHFQEFIALFKITVIRLHSIPLS